MTNINNILKKRVNLTNNHGKDSKGESSGPSFFSRYFPCDATQFYKLYNVIHLNYTNNAIPMPSFPQLINYLFFLIDVNSHAHGIYDMIKHLLIETWSGMGRHFYFNNVLSNIGRRHDMFLKLKLHVLKCL